MSAATCVDASRISSHCVQDARERAYGASKTGVNALVMRLNALMAHPPYMTYFAACTLIPTSAARSSEYSFGFSIKLQRRAD